MKLVTYNVVERVDEYRPAFLASSFSIAPGGVRMGDPMKPKLTGGRLGMSASLGNGGGDGHIKRGTEYTARK